MVFIRRLRMNGAIKLPSQMLKTLKISKILKSSIKILFSKKIKDNFRIFINRNICERTLLDVHVYKISSRYHEKWPTYDILKVENGNFSCYFLGLPLFHDFQILSNLGRSKSDLGLFFAFLTKNCPTNMHHYGASLFNFLNLSTRARYPGAFFSALINVV